MRPESNRRALRVFVSALFVLLIMAVYFIYRGFPWGGTAANLTRFNRLRSWFNDPAAHMDWAVHAGEHCLGSPLIFPTNGYIGFIWGDSFRAGHSHQGLDIFGGEAVGITPVIAAFPGYLHRLAEWKSSLIIRIPDDPLQPGRQIWMYYTHMADASGVSHISSDFPPGTSEKYVEAGTLLGYQGNYSGDPDNPTGVHLHFSIVKDDGQGGFLNELQIRNTLDPSPYFELPLNAALNHGEIPVCQG